MVLNFKNKTIVISGGTKGIGKQLAMVLIDRGANVVIGGRDYSSVKCLLREANKDHKKAIFVYTDLEKVDDCRKLFDSAVETFTKIDGFVNYAGVTPVASLTDCDEQTFDYIMNVNIKAAFFCTQFAIQHMKKNKSGSIILVGSAHAWGGEKDRAPYAISKGALLTLCEHISHNYATEKIRCNHVTMGWTATDGELSLRKNLGVCKEDLENEASKILPMGRMLTYDDHIQAFLYFLSDESSMVTGSNIRVTAGQYI